MKLRLRRNRPKTPGYVTRRVTVVMGHIVTCPVLRSVTPSHDPRE